MRSLLHQSGIAHAVCWAVIDCGVQTWWFNGEPVTHRELRIGWELIDETTRAGRRRVLTKNYNRSIWPTANLRRDLLSWLGSTAVVFHVKHGDEENRQLDDGRWEFAPLIGRGASLRLIERAGGYRAVDAVHPLPAPSRPEREPVLLDLDAFDVTAFHQLPETIRDHIMRSPTFLALHGQPVDPIEHVRAATTAELLDDEVPW